MHLITETGVWAQAKPPVDDWCKREDGIWTMNECPRSCPQMECIPYSFYGNLPIVYFFPELAISTLRTYKAYQFEDGRAPWIFGGITDHSGPWDMVNAAKGYQTVLNGSCYIEMINKMWKRTGDRSLLEEFYESARKCTDFTMNLRPEYGAHCASAIAL